MNEKSPYLSTKGKTSLQNTYSKSEKSLACGLTGSVERRDATKDAYRDSPPQRSFQQSRRAAKPASMWSWNQTCHLHSSSTDVFGLDNFGR